MVHCTDGWDRSTQLISLASILLDPYYRTGKGFAILIEKEFLSYGHQLGVRSGIPQSKESKEDQHSPVFIQFLDSVFQLISQFPTAFEFNEDFLLYLADNYYSLLYGTFLFNCDAQRKEHNAKTRTMSIWSSMFYLEDNEEEMNQFNYIKLNRSYCNAFYEEYPRNLLPEFGVRFYRVWEAFFARRSEIGNYVDNLSVFEYLKRSEDLVRKKEDLLERFTNGDKANCRGSELNCEVDLVDSIEDREVNRDLNEKGFKEYESQKASECKEVANIDCAKEDPSHLQLDSCEIKEKSNPLDDLLDDLIGNGVITNDLIQVEGLKQSTIDYIKEKLNKL